MLQILADARLITTGKETVEVAHEALIREWPTLREWLEEDREGLRVHRHLTEAAGEWERLQRDPAELYRGARLARALEWATGHDAALNPLERAFLAASEELHTKQEAAREAQRQRELEAARRLAEAQAQRAEEQERRAQAEERRAEEQTRSAGKLRQRAVWLALALVVALVAAITAGALGNQARLQSADNATLAAENVDVASTAQMDRAAAQVGEATAKAASTRAVSERSAAQTAEAEEALQRAAAQADRATAQAASTQAVVEREAAQTAEAEEALQRAAAQADRATAQAASTQAVEKKEQAEYQARVNLANALAVQSSALLEKRGELALLLALEAQGLFDTWPFRGALLTALEHHPYRVRFLTGHASVSFDMALSPDGSVLAVATELGPVHLYEVDSGASICVLSTGMRSLRSVAFSPDGKRLAAAGCAKVAGEEAAMVVTMAEAEALCVHWAVTLWDWAAGQPVASSPASDDLIQSIAFSPDGALLAIGGCGESGSPRCRQGEVILWDVERWEPAEPPLSAHAGLVYEVAFSPDGQTLATAGCGGRAPDGWCDSGEAILWDVSALLHTGSETGQVLHSLVGHGDEVYGLAFSPDGKVLITGSCDAWTPNDAPGQGDILLWDVETGQRIGQPLLGHPKTWVWSLAFSADGSTLASGGNGTVVLWDWATRRPIGLPLTGHTGDVFSLAFSPDGRTLASSGRDRTVGLWDLAGYGGIGSVLARGSPVTDLALSADGKTLAVGGCAHRTGGLDCVEGMAHLWALADDAEGRLVARRIGEPLTGFPRMVWSAALHSDGKTMALGGSDGTVRLWDIRARKSIREPLPAYCCNHWVLGLAFTSDGTVLASGSTDGVIHLWDAATWTPIGEPLTGHTRGVVRLAFSPDGQSLASASFDGTVRLWDVRTGQPVGLPLIGHTGTVWSLAFSPDGQILASGSNGDQTIRLWEVATGKPIGGPLLTHTGVGGLAFSPDGQTLFSGGGDGVIRQWDVDPDSWPERACRAVGRNMTQAEWKEYMPGLPYRVTCAQWLAGE